MTRAGVTALVMLAVAAGLALRLARLDARPMHHDEANQAVKFGALLEHGDYRYDAHDHHGPTLYYLALPAAKLRGQATLASLDERTLRGVTALFGAATILLLALLAAPLGRTAVAAAAWLLALSPAMVFYSRMFIQESLFACFVLWTVIAVGRLATGGGLVWFVAAGAGTGLAAATKETSMVVAPIVFVSAWAAWRSLGQARPRVERDGGWRAGLAAGLATAAAIAALFFSSFFAHPASVLEPVRGLTTYLDRGIAPANHAHPWHYYVGLLAYSASGGLRWSEGAVLLLALAGVLPALRPVDPADPRRSFWPRYLALVAMLTAAAFAGIRYKTPWNLLPFYVTTIVLAGVGASWVLATARARWLRAIYVALFAAACAHLGWQAWRASVTYSSDPRNPYVYAQTVPGAVRMAARILDLSAIHEAGRDMQVSVVAPTYEQWPLPWYLRTMPVVGYWTDLGDPVITHAPVIVSSIDHAEALDAMLGDRYMSEFHGLRPEVPLVLYVERGLWERYLARVASGELEPGCGSAPARGRHCGSAPAVALWQPALRR